MTKGQRTGVSGTLDIIFAIPTDDETRWRLKNGRITFEAGFTRGLAVEGGYIPHGRGPNGLTVTYCVFRSLEQDGALLIGDVSMITCVDGRVIDTLEVAQGVEGMLPKASQAPSPTGALRD